MDGDKSWRELENLENAAYFEESSIREMVKEVVPTYIENSIANEKASRVIKEEKLEAERRAARW